ncbi:hypothetical protein BDW22DRAFT_1357653 [Trametopsis cervina]|nr:hypothetical protein BDW22DRAFT_1357653 [Trametopsis cervina]
MPTVPVDNHGTVLYYEDSGVPEASAEYHTIFLIHGFIFNGAIFRPMFPFAAARNLRFISLNMREYPGSSPFSDSDLASWNSSDAQKQAAALRDQSLEIARAIAHLIKTENVPTPRPDKCKPVSLLFWSQSNANGLSILKNISLLDAEVKDTLLHYTQNIFMYDPPSMVLGAPFPPGVTTPLHNPKLPPEEKAVIFIEWVAEWLNPLPVPEAATDIALQHRYDMRDVTSDAAYTPTTMRLTPHELAGISSTEIAPRITRQIFLDEEVYDDNLRQGIAALNDTWKDCCVVVLCPDMTITTCILGCRAVCEVMASTLPEGNGRRGRQIVQVPGKNHFWHYEEPEEFVNFLAGHVQPQPWTLSAL